MQRDLRTSAAALLIFTILLGFGYSLALTGISQAVFGDKADGSQITVDGRVVGSELLAQDFSKDPSYFQSRPSATGYAGDVTYFNNLGPNSRKLARQLTEVRFEIERAHGSDRGGGQVVVTGPEQVGDPCPPRGTGVGAGQDVLLDGDVLEELE